MKPIHSLFLPPFLLQQNTMLGGWTSDGFVFTSTVYGNLTLIAKLDAYHSLLRSLQTTSNDTKLVVLSAVLDQVILDTCNLVCNFK